MYVILELPSPTPSVSSKFAIIELIGADKASLFINLVPLFSAFLGVIILNEKLQIFHFFSLIVILFGIYMFMVLGENYKKRQNL